MGKRKIQKDPKVPKVEDEQYSNNDPFQDHNMPKVAAKKVSKTSARKGSKNSQETSLKNEKGDSMGQDAELLSNDFIKRIDGFQGFYRQYLQLKISTNDQERDKQFERVNTTLHKKLKNTCSEVLKKDVSVALDWIEQKQKSFEQQIDQVDQAEANTRNALETSHTFSTKEIEIQMQGIKRKKAALVEKLKQLSEIKELATNISIEDLVIGEE